MFTFIWRRFLAERVTRSVLSRSAATFAQQAREAWPDPARRHDVFVPVHGISPPGDGPYMAYSTCSAADMKHRQFLAFCRTTQLAPAFHRKLWEWAFITHHLRRLGAVGEARRGLVFGVGTEPLPAYFASLGAEIVATDAPAEIGVAAGWRDTNQFGGSAEQLWRESLLDRDSFLKRVSYETCDMTNIPPHLNGFDFCWSSCCLEHLGSLDKGLDFVLNSVESTLKPGGIAVHTTEFNLSSDSDTITDGPTVIYRKRDMEALVSRLRERGHEVADFRIAPDSDPLDYYVDIPPNAAGAPHLKLRMSNYTITSVGLAIKRGNPGAG